MKRFLCTGVLTDSFNVNGGAIILRVGENGDKFASGASEKFFDFHLA